MECKKVYKQENILEYQYYEDGKPIFKVRYDLDLDINTIFQPERLSEKTAEKALNESMKVYEDYLSKPIPNEMKKLFCGSDSLTSMET